MSKSTAETLENNFHPYFTTTRRIYLPLKSVTHVKLGLFEPKTEHEILLKLNFELAEQLQILVPCFLLFSDNIVQIKIQLILKLYFRDIRF